MPVSRQSPRFSLLLGLLLVSRPVGAEPIPVTGDKALLELVHAAQLTNPLEYQTGRLKAKVHSAYLAGDMPSVVDVEATILWRGDDCYLSSTTTQTNLKGGKIEEIREIIATPSLRVSYSRAHKVMVTSNPAERTASGRRELELRPDQQWFQLEGVAPWAEFVDPEPAKKPRGAAVKEYVVAMDGTDRILIERRYVTDTVLRIVASLSADANIVEYESHGRQGMHWSHGVYDWQRDDSGRLYVKRYQWETTHLGNRRKPERTFTMDVTEFDPHPNIPANRFELSSLDAPGDTIVEEIGPGGSRSRHRLGGEVPRDVQSELDAAAKKVRSGKFAAPR